MRKSSLFILSIFIISITLIGCADKDGLSKSQLEGKWNVYAVKLPGMSDYIEIDKYDKALRLPASFTFAKNNKCHVEHFASQEVYYKLKKNNIELYDGTFTLSIPVISITSKEMIIHYKFSLIDLYVKLLKE